MLKLRYAIFALLLWATPFAAYAQDANQVPSLATFRANAYGGTVWLAGNVTPGDGGQGYFLPNGKQSVTHCVDNGATVIVDKNGTCWDRQGWGTSDITIPPVTADYTVAPGVHDVPVDTSAGPITITVPLDYGTQTLIYNVRIYKISSDSNAVYISPDGSTVDGYILNANDAGGAGYLDVEVNGTTLRVFGVH